MYVFLVMNMIHKKVDKEGGKLQRYIADLGRAWPVLVVCGGIAPLLLAVTWLIIIRYFVGVMTWLTIILLNVVTLFVTLFFYIKGTHRPVVLESRLAPVITTGFM